MKLLLVLQIIVSIFLIISIILQTRGSQAGITFGGTGETYRSKRGIEKFLFYITVFLIIIFALVSVIQLIL